MTVVRRAFRLDQTLASPASTGYIDKALLSGASGGVKAGFMLHESWCYPGGPYLGRAAQSTPTNGAKVCNIADPTPQTLSRSNDFSIVMPSGSLLAWDSTNKAIDFTACLKSGNVVQFPANTLSAIWADPNQAFLLWFYVVFPSLADMQAGTGTGWFTTAAGGLNTSSPDLLTIKTLYSASVVYLSMQRQTNGTSGQVVTNVTPGANCYGRICQVSYRRNAAGTRGKIWSIDDVVNNTSPSGNAFGSAGVNNTGNFAALVPQIGIPAGVNSASLTTAQQAGSNYKLLGCDLDALGTDTRDPDTILSDDFSRQISRYGWT